MEPRHIAQGIIALMVLSFVPFMHFAGKAHDRTVREARETRRTACAHACRQHHFEFSRLDGGSGFECTCTRAEDDCFMLISYGRVKARACDNYPIEVDDD